MERIAKQLKSLMTAEPPHLWAIVGASNAPLARRIAALLWLEAYESEAAAKLVGDINAKFLPGEVDYFVNQQQERRNQRILNGEDTQAENEI